MSFLTEVVPGRALRRLGHARSESLISADSSVYRPWAMSVAAYRPLASARNSLATLACRPYGYLPLLVRRATVNVAETLIDEAASNHVR